MKYTIEHIDAVVARLNVIERYLEDGTSYYVCCNSNKKDNICKSLPRDPQGKYKGNCNLCLIKYCRDSLPGYNSSIFGEYSTQLPRYRAMIKRANKNLSEANSQWKIVGKCYKLKSSGAI